MNWKEPDNCAIYSVLCQHHNIDEKEFAIKRFDVCHKVLPKINSFPIQAPANAGKTYILSSIKEEICNFGSMRCQDQEAFTFVGCLDKLLIFTDEMCFYQHNVDQTKCILDDAPTIVNVKNQS